MANQQHIEWLKEGVEAWNKRREVDRFTPDLSGYNFAPTDPMAIMMSFPRIPMEELRHLPKPPTGWIGARLHGINLSEANLQHTRFDLADLTDADLRSANMENAVMHQAFLCRANMRNTKLSHAQIVQANLVGADLTNARLENANFSAASLTDAKLVGASLTGTWLGGTWTTRTNFIGTNLSEVRHLPPELWKAKLYPENQHHVQHTLRSTTVEAVGDILEITKEISALSNCGDEELMLYFRGESQCGWELRPSVMRQDGLFKSEGSMLLELISRRPDDFNEAHSALSQWVLAQHHGLPTRFLDVTSNPLVALFHACDIDDTTKSEDGRVHVFAVPRSLVKPFNSDSVSIIANFAKLSRDDQNKLVPKPSLLDYPSAMRQLLQLIRLEKPYFEERIDPSDFFRVFIVEPQLSSERIRAQSGAFIVSVFHKRFEKDEVLQWNADTPVYTHYCLTVSSESKEDIRKELQLLNITQEKLFPGLDASAKTITEQTVASANH